MSIHRTPAVHLLSALPILLSPVVAGAQTTFEFVESELFSWNTDVTEVAIGDVDADGDLDLVIARFRGNEVWLNDGVGNFSDTGQELGTYSSMSIALGDLDGDEDLDIWVANGPAPSDPDAPNRVWLNDGNGTFTDSEQSLGNNESWSVVLGDVDGDLDLDAFVGNLENPNRVWLNDGNGQFVDSGQELGDSDTYTVALGDINGDGDLDAWCANFYGDDGLWLNDGSGNYEQSMQAVGMTQNYGVALGDLDGDEDLDAVVCDAQGGDQIWMNNGFGFFSDSGQRLDGGVKVTLGDLDGDGDLDGWFTTFNGIDRAMMNDGTGSFTIQEQALEEMMSFSSTLGDLDGDTDLDVASAGFVDKNLRIRMNRAEQLPAVLNRDSGIWYPTLEAAAVDAENGEDLVVGMESFLADAVVDGRGNAIRYETRGPAIIGPDLMLLPGDGSAFLDKTGVSGGYTLQGTLIAPRSGTLLLNRLQIGSGGILIQDDASIFFSEQIENQAGLVYLEGDVYSEDEKYFNGPTATTRVAGDTNLYGSLTNEGTTIVQRGILYVYGDIENSGTIIGEVNNGFMGGGHTEEGDGISIAGDYVLGSEAALSLPDPIWRLGVGGRFDIAINDPSRFKLSMATIEMTGLTGGPQKLETLSLDVGPTEDGFNPANFPIGSLRIKTGSETFLVNNHPNFSNAPCEVLYVDALTIEPGGRLVTNGCRIYTRQLFNQGVIEGEDGVILLPGCDADLNGDDKVDGSDLAFILGSWGSAMPGADINEDGTVDGTDLAILLGAWGACP
ncbi:MAG: FG-GAP-like repeat-containing protein [Phycisphaerales bacterium]|nr:FG-GAP-like repeat-containing protein [Phycisphaerales bacterium]